MRRIKLTDALLFPFTVIGLIAILLMVIPMAYILRLYDYIRSR